jgi:hypothetical protein
MVVNLAITWVMTVANIKCHVVRVIAVKIGLDWYCEGGTKFGEAYDILWQVSTCSSKSKVKTTTY